MERDSSLDAVKAFAIILVILGHCIQYGSGQAYLTEETYFNNPLFKWIYSFHMPLFMLLSGYLFGNSVQKNKWYVTLGNRARSLLVPVFIWALVPFLISLFRQGGAGLSPSGLLNGYLFSALTNLWFLWAIFWCSAVVILVRTFCKDSLLVYGLGFLATFVTPDSYCLDLYKYMYPFFVIGYLFRTRPCRTLQGFRRHKWLTVAVLSAVYIALLLTFSRNTYIYVSHYQILTKDGISSGQILTDLHRLLVGLTGGVLAILAVRYLYNRFGDRMHGFLKKALLYTGRNTMGVYIISTYCCLYLLTALVRKASYLPLLNAILETVTVLALSLLCVRVIRKSHVAGELLLGIRRRTA